MNAPLSEFRILDLGSRVGSAGCSRLLADLGASVFVVEPRTPRHDRKWIDRALATAGRWSVLLDPGSADDIALVSDLAGRCDAAIVSSDVDVWPAALAEAIREMPIVCDVTAFGHTGPLAGRVADDVEIQAMTGVMYTTGSPDDTPAPVGVPVMEFSAGLYAAAATTLALRELRSRGVRQTIDVAVYDTAFNALTTFLPSHFAGKAPGRLGNGHSMAVPWNAYHATDGWVLICSASDQQWRRLAAEIAPSLADDPRYATLEQRIAARSEVDAILAEWLRKERVARIVERLTSCGIASGAIVPLTGLTQEPNLAHREAVVETLDPAHGTRVRTPGPLIRFEDWAPPPPTLPEPRDTLAVAATFPPKVYPERAVRRRPLAGLRVVEIGQFTTAPLAARHLATFGADVIKVEPEGGDSARAWAPHRNGTSHFFVMSNGTKRSAAVDLRAAEGRAAFERLVASADVLVENMKPGSLERLGFPVPRLRSLNPRLIYCAISGFGAHSVYAGRPAFDTVVQAMSGMMDATRVHGVPMKSGISAADIGGGQAGLLAILAALARRDRTGQGASIDIAMQDVGAWFTQTAWNRPHVPATWRGSVSDLAEVCANPQTAARGLIVRRCDGAGTEWELLGSPLRLSATPPRIGTPLGPPVDRIPEWLQHDEASGSAMHGAIE